MILGVHISGVGKIYETAQEAHKLGCNTLQIFLRNPQQWKPKKLDPEDIEKFKSLRKKYKLNPVFVHISYLINLASPEIRLYKGSIHAYIEDIKQAGLLEADYIVTHMGSHKETSEEEGIKRLTSALNEIIEKTSDLKVGILLENTSGSGSWLGYTFKHHQEIISGIKQKERIGVCFDTAHAYLAGYDLASQEGLENTLTEIEKTVGLDLVKLIHLNDADGALGSHRDRHADIGKGSIGQEGMKRIINHPKLKDKPFILETPKEDEESDKINLKTVKKLAKQR